MFRSAHRLPRPRALSAAAAAAATAAYPQCSGPGGRDGDAGGAGRGGASEAGRRGDVGLGRGAAAPRGKSVGVTLGGVNLSATETEGEPEEKWGRRGANRETCLGLPGVDSGGPPSLTPRDAPPVKACLSGDVPVSTLFRWRPIIL